MDRSSSAPIFPPPRQAAIPGHQEAIGASAMPRYRPAPWRLLVARRTLLAALCACLLPACASWPTPSASTTPLLAPPASALTLCPLIPTLDPSQDRAEVVLRRLVEAISDSAATCAAMHREAVEWQRRQIERAGR
jgi:hypothetical protein